MENSLIELDKMLAAGYVLGDLSEEELVRVNKLLQTNPEFLQEVRSLTASLNLVPTALPKFIPPASVKGKIFAAYSKFEKSKSKIQRERNFNNYDVNENNITSTTGA